MAKQEWVEDSVGLNKRDRWIKQIAYNLILIIVCIAVLYPVIWVVQMALTPNEMAGLGGGFSLDKLSFSNFEYVLCNPDANNNNECRFLFFYLLLNIIFPDGKGNNSYCNNHASRYGQHQRYVVGLGRVSGGFKKYHGHHQGEYSAQCSHEIDDRISCAS